MTTTGSDQPIYERLVRERGDVVAESRAAAEATQRQANDLLDWRLVRHPESRPDGRLG
ncbi:hypothetical protein [Streptomyces piniterrae]|uniref:hypothetical protein n=1 Tax=Streptomyces piniterrae TaxID=2571125 RepID=UPI00145DA4C3|nr:hypothetical protein [Streptomyces piniterrae]